MPMVVYWIPFPFLSLEKSKPLHTYVEKQKVRQNFDWNQLRKNMLVVLH